MNQINDGKIKTLPAQPPSGRIAHLSMKVAHLSTRIAESSIESWAERLVLQGNFYVIYLFNLGILIILSGFPEIFLGFT
ncbi:MAG: hypothetical protein LBK82_14405 [Planctomycetaceae bacterium]|nr:hypothetical protein [Planctomycetaceae bacterium]